MQNTEWLNRNALRAYPIQENMGRAPSINKVPVNDLQLPNALLLDFNMCVPGDGTERVWLSRLVFAGNVLSLTFSEIAGGTVIATATADVSGYPASAYITLSLLAAYGHDGVTGRVVIGNLASIRETWADGVYEFSSDQTEMEFCLIRTVAAQLSGVRVVANGNTSPLLTGTIKLVAGENIKLVYRESDNAIVINAVPGEGYFENCGPCPVSDNIVRTINGIPLQDVKLVAGNPCMNIETSGDTITFTDLCSTPCCGCSELEAATTKLTEFDALTSDIQTYRNNLEGAIALLETALAQVTAIK